MEELSIWFLFFNFNSPIFVVNTDHNHFNTILVSECAVSFFFYAINLQTLALLYESDFWENFLEVKISTILLENYSWKSATYHCLSCVEEVWKGNDSGIGKGFAASVCVKVISEFNGLVVKTLDSKESRVQNHWVTPRSTQPFILPGRQNEHQEFLGT